MNGTVSPQHWARTAGALYLIVIVAGIFAEMFGRERLIVHNDAAATATNILSHESLFRWSFAADLLGLLCVVPLILLLFEIFKVVNVRIALLAVFFSLIGTAVQSVALLGHFAPLILLKTLPPMEREAYLALRLQSAGFSIALAFFGGTMLARGTLILRSRIVPRVIGGALLFEGFSYLANTFANFVAPNAAPVVFAVLMVSGLAEVALCLWLLIRGINVEAWRELAAPAV